MISSKPAPQAPNPPHNALPWRRHTAQKYLAHLSATKAKTAQKIVHYIAYRYRLGEYTAQFTYHEIASHIGKCTKTIQRYIHQLITKGLIAVVRPGKSAAHSPTQANEAPIYTLLLPAVKNVHPLKTFKKSVKSLKDNPKNFPLTAVVESTADRWAATEQLKNEVLDLQKVPTVLLVGHMRTIFAAGWCVKDVLVALKHNPEWEVYQSHEATNHRFHGQTQVIEHLKRWCRVPRPGTTNTHIYTSIRDPCKKYTLSFLRFRRTNCFSTPALSNL